MEPITPLIDCPTPEKLHDFLLGRLPEDELQRIGDHLGVCRHCSSRVSAQSDDRLVAELRQSLREPPTLEEHASERLIAKAESIYENSPPPDDIHNPSLTGGTLGPYEILDQISSTGISDVYKARHIGLDRLVTLKTLSGSFYRELAQIAMFHREMAVSRLLPDHPHVLRATDASVDKGIHYLVLDYVPGADLATIASHGGPMRVPDAAEAIRQAAVGLAHLHSHGLVHRDIKPANLMLTPDGNVKILDLSRALMPENQEDRESVSTSWMVVGNPWCIAPEQIFDAQHVGPAADIYSLGCTLFRLLCGRAPFDAETHNNRQKLLQAHWMEPPPPVRAFRPDAPRPLDKLIGRLLSKSPEQRERDASRLARDLEAFTTGHDLPLLLKDPPPAVQLEMKRPPTLWRRLKQKFGM